MTEKDFITYEYRTKSVKVKDLTRTADLYEAFGWEIVSTERTAVERVTLSLRRDRKLPHRQELNRLERQAEELSGTLDGLERAKRLRADIFAYIFGIVAALVLGGGMCMVMLIEDSVPALIGGIAVGVVGLVLCAVNYPVYRAMVAKKTEQVLPALDENEEKLADLLERGNDLLRADLI